MKKLLFTLCIFASIILFTGCNSKQEKIQIGIVQIVEHQSLDVIRDSIIEKLRDLGYTEDNSIIYTKSASNDMAIANQIISEYKSKGCDIIIPIATPTAQAAMNVSQEIPVIFSAVSDPIKAGLIDDLDHPNKNITGTSDEIQVDAILELALLFNPDIKKIGVIYNPSEANSVSNINKLKSLCSTYDINIVEIPCTSALEIAANITSLGNDIDMIFTPNDNTVATKGGMNILNSYCTSKDIPLYVGADSMVLDGGFATIGINYVNLGYETAIMVDKVLKGTNISDIPVKVFKDDLKIYINKQFLNSLGYQIPDGLDKSNIVYVGE